MSDSENGNGYPTQQPQLLPPGAPNPATTDINDHEVEVTQADDVPEIMLTKMPKFGLLEHDTNPRAWTIVVEYALAPLRLKKIIDSNVARPSSDHPKYDRWVFWSCTIASWMYIQIDTTLQEKIQNITILPKYADEMMDEIMLMVQGNLKGDNALNEIRRFSNLKRSKFNSTKEFITEFQKQYYVLSRFKIQPHPFHALAQILTELENEVPKVQFIVEELGRIEPKKITLSHVE